MRISVAIPAYNCSATIRGTLESVLAQTVQPDEILVLDDGSTDTTASILADYVPGISLMRQENSGVASARNALCARASGDLIAFLDSDDLWHPKYLEVQRRLFQTFPDAVTIFTRHVNFYGSGLFQWGDDLRDADCAAEVISPLNFLKRYNRASGAFTMNCCVAKAVFRAAGPEPFKLRAAEDLFFFNLVAPLGPVVYYPVPLTAYRIREGSLSSNRLELTEAETRAFELLEEHYRELADPALRRVFWESFAMKRRLHSKVLLRAGEVRRARIQLWQSVTCCASPLSITKSLALLLLTTIPAALQPKWPPIQREWKSSARP